MITKALGAAWAFFLDAFSFLFVIAALWRLPDPPPFPPPGPEGAASGARSARVSRT